MGFQDLGWRFDCSNSGEEIGVRNREKSGKLVEVNLQYPGLSHIHSHLENAYGPATIITLLVPGNQG